MTEACCHIVIPVFNALDAVLDLLHSLACSTSYPHKVTLVDDCSHNFVAKVLREWCESRSEYSYVRNEQNLGFVKTVNRAVEMTTSEYVCVLNSDTVVTNHWLERLVSAVERDPFIAVANPATNAAPSVAVPLPPGYSIHMMAQRLAALNLSGDVIEVVTGVGFCWFLTRDIIRRFGMFDEVYSPGYCEEADYAMRVRNHGYKIVVAVSSFVFHRGAASFAESQEPLYLKHREIFDHRWKTVFDPAASRYCENDPLQSLRKTLFEDTIPVLHAVRAPEIISKLRGGWNRLRRGEFRILVKRVRETLSDITRHRKALARSSDPRESAAAQGIFNCRNIPLLGSETFFPTVAHSARLPWSESRLRIVFLVWELTLCGGVTDIVQMVNQLVLQGHDPIIVTLNRACSSTYAKRLLTRPLVFKNLDHLVEAFPQSNVVVATFWPTAYYWYPRLAQRHDFVGAYYVQDFEPFFAPDGSGDYKRAMETYSLGLNVIAISDWIRGKLAEVGQPATRIPAGIDLGIFYPRRSFRPKALGDEFILTSMVRPTTPYRGFQTLVKACEILHAQDPRIRFKFFGCDSSAFAGISFPWESAGLIEDPETMAEHLSSSDLLVDPSDFQGFGLCGLEAMACGLPTVLTNEGGTWDYGVHGENTLMAHAKDPHDFARRVLQIRRDPCLQERLSQGSLDTAKKFCHRKIGRLQSEYFQSLVAKITAPEASETSS